jgi:hypothetical protein
MLMIKGRWAVLLTGTLGLTGCVIERPGPMQHDSQSIDRDNSESVRVNLDMGAGTLRVAGGTDKLAAAVFDYNVPSWKPEVHYSSAAGHGSLTVKQGGHVTSGLGDAHYEWDLRLNREVPLEIEAHLGAGEAHLDLGDLTLRSVDVGMGAGQLNLDLRGTPKKSYEVRVEGGVGEAIVRLPSSVGVEAEVMGGIGEVSAPGLHRDGKRYFNDAVSSSKVVIHLDIQGGVGSIRLISD